jgi:hypothetical protein
LCSFFWPLVFGSLSIFISIYKHWSALLPSANYKNQGQLAKNNNFLICSLSWLFTLSFTGYAFNQACDQCRSRLTCTSMHYDQDLLSSWYNLIVLKVNSVNPDQTAWMCRLIWIFSTCPFDIKSYLMEERVKQWSTAWSSIYYNILHWSVCNIVIAFSLAEMRLNKIIISENSEILISQNLYNRYDNQWSLQ